VRETAIAAGEHPWTNLLYKMKADPIRVLLQRCCLLVLGFIAGMATASSAAQVASTSVNFSFVPDKVDAGRSVFQVGPDTVYSKERGYGFVNPVPKTAKWESNSSVCGDGKPFSFAVDLPEGNYDVNVLLGDRSYESTTTLKVEARRLVLKELRTAPGRFESWKFTVNVRRGQLASGETVRFKRDEQSHLDWDDRLTFEFAGVRPCVHALEISKADNAVTIYLAGDSTVTDQPKEPWSSWGQMLPRFFKQGVAIANHAESGESLKSFVGERRLQKILETMKAGDYLFIQFAHNDQKPGPSHVDPFSTYQETLKLYVDEARKRNAIPVFVTSMHRRKFDDQGRIVNTLGDYPEAMRQLAKKENVPLIDLNAMSKALFEALGPEGTLKAFVHYPAETFPGQQEELKDDTHFNAYGAYELAQCVVAGIRANRLGIVKYLADDARAFDPSRPDPPATWYLPSSQTSAQTGSGNP
jgi:lysophospholipase L1-like esterase